MTRCFYSKVLYAKSSEISISTGKPNSFTTLKKTPYSFVTVSEEFIKSVEKMESVVLVPTKLVDIPIHSETSNQVSPIIIPEITASGHSNLFEVFHLVRKFKDKLLGINSAICQEEDLGTLIPNGSLEVDDTIYSFRPSPIPPNQLPSAMQMVNVSSGSIVNGTVGGGNTPSIACSSGIHGHGHDSGIWSSSSFVDTSGSIESVSLPVAGSVLKDGTVNNDRNGSGSCSSCSSLTSSSSSSEVSEMDYDSGLQFLPTSQLNTSTSNLVSPGSCRGGITSGTVVMSNVVQASCVVRKSLHSAKSLCAFLVDLCAVTQFIMDRYLEELNCGYSE